MTGTTNDFDSTPWVTGGSAGSKNVPIFCCSGIDANSAGASFTTCTDSVSTGYYGIVSFETISFNLSYMCTYFSTVRMHCCTHFWNTTTIGINRFNRGCTSACVLILFFYIWTFFFIMHEEHNCIRKQAYPK